MYYLYIDESGDIGDYRDANDNIIPGSSKYFTLAGIIVNDETRIAFEEELDKLLTETFDGIELPECFKLHYQELRQRYPPYDQIDDVFRWNISDSIFKWIENAECWLLSVTIDLDKHCKYTKPADPRAYSLLLILERFQYFLQEKADTGIAIYEKFNAKMRKKAEAEQKWLQKIPKFPVPTNLNLLKEKVRNGDPVKEPMLQIADFFAYAPWIKQMSNGQATDRFYQILPKYYNLGERRFLSGIVEL
ncbi:MAG: DUF3800 domain-containing protein [Nitrosarchaeum sp.]|nr:DUF3800 domain-containing protein [Nitrosarchaeum sp.]